MGDFRLSMFCALTRIAVISLAHLIVPTGFAVAATLQIQNETGFAMRVELVTMTSDDLPDVKDSLKALHLSNRQGGIIDVEAGRYFLLPSNPTGARVPCHAQYSPKTVSGSECPPGYRLHYQGECINLEDEQRNEGQGPVRMVAPRPN
ncbi:hypothetical protein K1W69_19345 [Hoeflea sp. WL0058]|uniref:Uncharacterized protein n=1 Tax=Flavimaribacter sediminis TaxID=2865987 RepID=A0AAE2ZRV0_9HYPH|nr:hypothetical protein [Flavimaribacter sediminis]MBW8639358.1 hypothetical protein [Flavimaribacter sediminis]